MSLIPGNNGRIEDILKISPKDQKKKLCTEVEYITKYWSLYINISELGNMVETFQHPKA